MSASPPNSAPTGAVFLSYAREDTDAARRIADALRAFGVEVWFDQSELRGGDAWDQKIKKQIRECALFLPLISAQTQARGEGYFRREWLLAVDRTRDIAQGLAFIVPVSIDETREADAAVPEEFMRYQWTRLAHGVPSPQFVEQVKRLLEAPRLAAPVSRASPVVQIQRVGGGIPKATWPMVALAAAAGVGIFLWQRASPAPAAAVVMPPAVTEKSSAPASEVRKLVEKAKQLQEDYAQDDTLRDNLTLAEELCKRAVALDPTDGEAWAISARVAASLSNFDTSPARLEQGRAFVQRAVQLAPDSVETGLAMAEYYRKQVSTIAEAERVARELVQRAPNDKRTLRMLGLTLNALRKGDEALVYYARAATLPGGDPKALLSRARILFNEGRFGEAEAAVSESLVLRPTAAAQFEKLRFLLLRGEMVEARALLEKVPASSLIEDRGAFTATLLWLRLRQPEKVLAVLRGAPRDYFDDSRNSGPKAYFSGYAYRLEGNLDAARAEWRLALQVIQRRLAAQANDPILLRWEAVLLALLGDGAEANRVLRLSQQLGERPSLFAADPDFDVADILLALGRNDDALSRLTAVLSRSNWLGYRASLRYDPWWDALRGDPRFEALLKESEKKK